MIDEIYYIVTLNILFFCTGYCIGRLRSSQAQNFGLINSKKDANVHNKQNVSIDETKVVTKIDTNKLQKKYDIIGEETQSLENISSAINKLKNMKG
jgi:hypothetical protein